MKALCWWRREDVWYPTTAQVARKHLSIYGTSVPSKRLFSLSGHIARNQLLPENVNKLFFGKKHGLTLFLYIALYNRDHFYNCNQNMKQ